MTPTVSWNRWLFLTLSVALVLRVVLALGVQHVVSGVPGRLCLITGDAEGYWELAGNIAAFKDYSIYDPPRFLLRMPGFPILLAISRFLFGNNPLAARLLLACVGTLACGLTYWFGRELAGDDVGIVAAAYTAVSPAMCLFSVLFLSETAFAAAILASLIAAAKLLRQETKPPSSKLPAFTLAFITGLLAGMATYMRPTWLLVGPGLAIFVIVMGRQSLRLKLIQAVLICLGLTVMMSPWIYRNARLTGHLIPTTLWMGPSLYDGLNPSATGDSDMKFFDQEELMRTMSEYEMDREYRRCAWQFATDHPAQVVRLALAKQWRYWNPAPNAAQFKHPAIYAIACLSFTLLIIFALLGAWVARTEVPMLILTIAPILYFASLHLLFVGSLRYRLPAEYPLAALAALGFCRSVCPRQNQQSDSKSHAVM